MKIDEKILKKMLIVTSVFVALIILIAIISKIISNKKYTLTELENKIHTLTEQYYKTNKDELPKKGETKTLSANYFVSTGKLKSLKLKDGSTCSGEVNITNNNGNYLIVPVLECGDKKADPLFNVLTEKAVTSGNGLYKKGDTYIFRGDNVNNYIMFAGRLWRILRINSDGTFRIIDETRSATSTWDNRYNIERKSMTGINDFILNDINSRIKDSLDMVYENEKFFTSKDKSYISMQDLCVGKRNNEGPNDGSIECSVKIEDQFLGLIQANEYVEASLDLNCNSLTDISCGNYNFLKNNSNSSWTITADKDTNYKVYKLHGSLSLTNASSASSVRTVVHLNKNILYSSGTGEVTDPYKIK